VDEEDRERVLTLRNKDWAYRVVRPEERM
jgi:hypothetical protein